MFYNVCHMSLYIYIYRIYIYIYIYIYIIIARKIIYVYVYMKFIQTLYTLIHTYCTHYVIFCYIMSLGYMLWC